MKPFEIQFEWLPRSHGSVLEKATLAEIKISVHGRVLTEMLDKEARTVRDHVVVSAWDLAVWVTSNWWRLHWETAEESLDWKLTHYISSIGNGYIWPDIRFHSDWNAMLVDFQPFDARTAPARFIGEEAYLSVPISDFEGEVDRFVNAVLKRVRDQVPGMDEEAAALFDLWDEVREERNNPSISEFRRLEAIAGFDPGNGPDSVLQMMIRMASEWGSGAMDEIAAEAKGESANVIDRIQSLPKSRKHELNIGDWEKLPKQASASQAPWERGHHLARQVRETLSLGGDAISTREFADLLGVTEQYLRGTRSKSQAEVPFDIGFQDNASGDLSCVLQGKRETTRRFALARLLGDSLFCNPTEHVLPITKAKTDRQKFNRAFAQEFLCPLAALEDYFGGPSVTPDKVQEAADHFNVSPMLIDMTYVNRRRMRWLLNRYGEDWIVDVRV